MIRFIKVILSEFFCWFDKQPPGTTILYLMIMGALAALGIITVVIITLKITV